MSKFNTGKASILVLTAVLAVAAFLLGKTLTSVLACDPRDGWGECVSTGPQCGTDNGTQSKTKDRGFDYSCPEGYQSNPDHGQGAKDCRKVKTAGYYACHEGWTLNGHVCKKDGQDDQNATWVEPIYSYSNKVKVYKGCDDGWTVDPANESKCVKTQSCPLEHKDYSGCDQEGTCPTTCGYAGGTVPDGRGGQISCEATQACETPAPTPTEGTSFSNPGAPVCNAAKPGTPTILSAVRSGTQENLTWSAVPNATYYSVVYGSAPGYQYGIANVGNVTSYTVNSLNPGATYHFAVNAVNDCMPGDPGVQSGTGTGGQVLGASTMGKTGSFDEIFYQVIMGIGATLSTLGLKGLKKGKKVFAK